MAVSKKDTTTETSGDITITNGDWQALKSATTAYGVTDESDIIAFAIGILDKSNGRGVVVETTEGRMKFIPSDKLKKPPQTTDTCAVTGYFDEEVSLDQGMRAFCAGSMV